jgi:hypothetical protein
MNSRNLVSTSFVRTRVRNLLRTLCAPLLSAALLLGPCQLGLAQYEALELGPEEAATPALSASSMAGTQRCRHLPACSSGATSSSRYRPTRLPPRRMPAPA